MNFMLPVNAGRLFPSTLAVEFGCKSKSNNSVSTAIQRNAQERSKLFMTEGVMGTFFGLRGRQQAVPFQV